MIVGTEWLIEAIECDAENLRRISVLKQVFADLAQDLQLKTVGKVQWHQFPEPGNGITGFAMLTESHFACHTYPEHQIATFNLYCCRTRPEWDWTRKLSELLGAKHVQIKKIERGVVIDTATQMVEKNAVNFNRRINQPRFRQAKLRERRLPHLKREMGIYFVTFRLSDSLPSVILNEVKLKRAQADKIQENSQENLSKASEKTVIEIHSEEIEQYLDKGIGACALKNEQIAQIVANAIKYFQNKRYRLFAWCIMPNHVHVVLQPYVNHNLSEILHSWKSFTSKEANKILKLEGAFWQREYYDHLIRDHQEFNRIIQYVRQNPAKANLKNWKWVEILTAPNGIEDVSAGRAHDNRQDVGATYPQQTFEDCSAARPGGCRDSILPSHIFSNPNLEDKK